MNETPTIYCLDEVALWVRAPHIKPFMSYEYSTKLRIAYRYCLWPSKLLNGCGYCCQILVSVLQCIASEAMSVKMAAYWILDIRVIIFKRLIWGKTSQNYTKTRHIRTGNSSKEASQLRAPPPIKNRSPDSKPETARASHQIYMYFSTDNSWIHAIPLWQVVFKPEMAQKTHLNYGHLIQKKPPYFRKRHYLTSHGGNTARFERRDRSIRVQLRVSVLERLFF